MSRQAALAVVFAVTLAAAACSEPPPIPTPDDLSQISDPRLLEALGKARAQVESDPRSALAWVRLGHVYLAHKWDFESAGCYRQAIELEPGEARWYYYLGRSLYTLDDRQAAEAFARSIQLGGEYPPTLFHYGKVLAALGEVDAARRQFERLAAIEPGEPHALLALGELALAAGKPDEAREQMELAVAAAPEFSEAHAGLAKLRLALGDPQGAAREAELARRPSNVPGLADPLWQAVELMSAAPAGFFARADFFFQAGEIERGLGELEKVVDGGQDDPEVWLYYARMMFDHRRFDRVAKAMDAIVELAADGRHRLAPDRLALGYVLAGAARARIGDAAGAERDLRRALQLDPESKAATEELAALGRGGRAGTAAPRGSD